MRFFGRENRYGIVLTPRQSEAITGVVATALRRRANRCVGNAGKCFDRARRLQFFRSVATTKSAVSDRGYSLLRQDLVSQTAVGYRPGHFFCIKVVRETLCLKVRAGETPAVRAGLALHARRVRYPLMTESVSDGFVDAHRFAARPSSC